MFFTAVLLALQEGGAWGQWRGPLATGTAPDADPPVEWSESKNIRWKRDLPGLGHSTPVVWGDRIYLTSAVPVGDRLAEPIYDKAPGSHDNAPVTHRYRFAVTAVDRRDGRVLWEKTLREGLPHVFGHETGSLASASPVTDGKRIFAFFGSQGLYALDPDGALLWKADFGLMQTLHAHGEGASPALHGDTVVINWDHEGGSFVAALDATSGKQRWRMPREEPTSWATPIFVEHAGATQVVVSGTNRVRGYDLATGKVLWECPGLPTNVVASPVAGHGMVFAGASYERQAFLAIRLDAAGGDRVAWSRDRRAPYVPSPLLYGDWIYSLAHYQGILSRTNARTGAEPAGPFRLREIGSVYASPVAAAGRLYVTDLEGTTVVLDHEDPSKVLSVNRLDDRISASAAIAGRELFLRGARRFYCIIREP